MKLKVLSAPSALSEPDVEDIRATGVACIHDAILDMLLMIFDQGVRDRWQKAAEHLNSTIALLCRNIESDSVIHETTLSSMLSTLLARIFCEEGSDTFILHQCPVGRSRMDIGAVRLNCTGFDRLFVIEVSKSNKDKEIQLFGYINNIFAGHLCDPMQPLYGAIVQFSLQPTFSLYAYYPVWNEEEEIHKLAVVRLFDGAWEQKSICILLEAISIRFATQSKPFTEIPQDTDHNRNVHVDIDAKIVTKVYDYRFRKPRFRRRSWESINYIHGCHYIVEENDIQIIRYPLIEGTHLAQNNQQFAGVFEHLLSVHNDNKVHGDIRLSNIIFSSRDGRESKLIDFDFCGTDGLGTYPGLISFNIADGQRHTDVAGGGIMRKEHDYFALSAILNLFTPDSAEFQEEWTEIINLVSKGKLEDARKELLANMYRINLREELREALGSLGTGSPEPPKEELVLADNSLRQKKKPKI